MELCDKYLGELIFFNPPINDDSTYQLNVNAVINPMYIQEEYYKRIHKLNKKYKKYASIRNAKQDMMKYF